jgi:hypothetical protein
MLPATRALAGSNDKEDGDGTSSESYRAFGGRIDGAARADLVAGDRRYVDDVPTFLPGHVRQRGGDAVEHAFQVHVDEANRSSACEGASRRHPRR